MELSFELPSTADAAPLARSRLAGLGTVLNGAVLVDLLLVVTELVSGALRQGPRGPLRIFVRASAPTRVSGEVAGEAQLSGWGLQLVDAIVSRWGVREGSTHVWFEIDRG